MNVYQAGDIRNFAVVGHASSGKTVLSEAMLACSGVIGRLGGIASGSTTSDYHADEKERKISIYASLLHTEWLGKKFNLIDTPGYLDFTGEAISGLRAADFALVVIHAYYGIGVGTEMVWKYATHNGIPKVIVANAFDKEHAIFDELLAKIRARFGERVFPLSLPVNAGPGFNQVLDVMRKEIITYQTDGSGKFTEAPATGEWKTKADQLHQALIEYIAEADDALLEKFFEQGNLSEEELRAGIHAAAQKGSFIPLLCTAAETNVGVARLMDFIAKYGSSPLDRAKAKAVDANGTEIEIGLSNPEAVLQVFKTSSEEQFGQLSFFRVYSGKAEMGMDLYNSDRKTTERMGQIYILNGKNRTPAGTLSAGDIGAVVKLKDTHTGNTLSAGKRAITVPRIEFPTPNIHQAIRLRAKGEEDKLAQGLAALHEEDPTFLYKVDSELHQTVISGQGELQLQVAASRLRLRYKIEFDLVEPRVPYRETIKARAESKFRHKKQTGGAGQFAEVWMRIEPKPRNTGVEFTQTLSGQNVDRVFVPSVEKGVMSACTEGIVAGYRVVDVKIDFYDGKMHAVDSNDISFQIAGKGAFKEAFTTARPCLLEPIYTIDIRIPEDCMGNVIGDLSSRRGKILGMDSVDGATVVKATVPQKELYQYANVLRSLTGGRGVHSEQFSHYEEMPRELEARITAEAKKPPEPH